MGLKAVGKAPGGGWWRVAEHGAERRTWGGEDPHPGGPGLLFAGRFLITVSISMLVMGLLRFSVSSWSSFGKLYFSKNLSISSTLSILLAYNC